MNMSKRGYYFWIVGIQLLLNPSLGFKLVPSTPKRPCQNPENSFSNGLPLVGPQYSSYGRGSEIWPPSNEGPVKLTDSFPGGKIPEAVNRLLKDIGSHGEKKPIEWRKILPRALARILRRAARAQEQEAFFEDTASIDKTPVIVSLILLLRGYIRPLDLLLVVFFSGYLAVLHMVAGSMRPDGITPNLPALPPQGHVPALVANPLGYSFSYSLGYDRWLKIGVIVGLLGPLLQTIQYSWKQQFAAASICARPLFLLCCQAFTEAVFRRILTPLPLRVLIPLSYNVMRLGYLWQWSCFDGTLGPVGRFLGASNFLYWTVNLFGFLLPTAVPRYLRAHFYCVEAEQVITRPGMDDSIGIML